MHRNPTQTPVWRFLNSGSGSAAYNMAVDEAIVEAVRNGASPTLRVYGWSPSAVSIGYSQQLESEVAPGTCKAHDIDIVRRQTGGRTVLHAQEITYSVIAPEGHPAIGTSAYENYRIVSEALLNVLQAFNLPGELAAGPESTPTGSDGACFSYAARFEVVVHAKKIIGSAQRRARGVVLQHGSILIGPGHKRLPMLLPFELYDQRERLLQDLEEHTISLSELLDRTVTYDEIVPLIKAGFESRLDITFEDRPLTTDEQKTAHVLTIEKYGNYEWTTRTRPHDMVR